MTFDFTAKEREVVDVSVALQENPSISHESQCAVCPLADELPLAVTGKGKKKILVVFSHPTKGDIQMGKLSVSHAYMRLQQDFRGLGYDLEEDCWITSAVRCFPHAQIPSKKMYECCRGKLYATVQRLKPVTVLVVGRNAMHGWKGHQFALPPRIPDHYSSYHDTDYDAFVGHHIPDREYAFEVAGKVVCPIVIPLFNMHDVTKLEQKNMSRGIQSVVPFRHKAVLAMALDFAQHMKYHTMVEDIGGKVQKVWNAQEAIAILRMLNVPSLLAFDYETTGLKPYDKGHRIVMVALSNGKTSYAIPFFEHNAEFLQAYKELMTNPKVKKICHNLKYEYNWTRKILGYKMQGVFWDTMLVAHILDMRDKTTGLKFQGYVKFGISGYDKVTKKLLAPPKKVKGSNGKNWLQYLDTRYFQENYKAWDVSLEYVGEDAALTFALYRNQKEELLDTDYRHLMQGINLFMETTITLAEMEYNGFAFDYAQCEKNKIDIKQQMVDLKERMKNTKEYNKWQAVYPDKELNTNSSKQLKEFFYDILKYTIPKYNKSGNPSTDKEALEQINSEFTNLMLEYKALDKMLNSFLVGYEAEANDDGRLRCFFNMNNVKSYRTSSSNVNLQNVSHHAEIARYALNLMKAHPGHVMLNIDYKSLEVYGGAAHTKDPKLLEYLHDETTDMHRDVACDIHFYEPQDLPKRLRTIAKKFTFGAFYGAGYKSIAVNQWKDLLAEDKQRLKEHGIRSFIDFEQHIKEMFDKFWNVRFKQYTRWKKRQWNFYVKNGYFVGHTGFLYTGICNPRQVSNFPIQGDAAHILLLTANFMYKYIVENHLESLEIAEVHDSLMFSCPPEEVPLLLSALQEFLIQLPSLQPWTQGLDFVIEAEQSAVNGSWGEMIPIAKISGQAIELFATA